MAEINQETLYPNWMRHQRLQEDMVRKGLDLPDGEVKITNNTTTNTGVSGGKILAGILGGTGMASIAACVIAWMALSGQHDPQPVPQQPAQQEVQLILEHFDQFDEPIYVAPADKEP